MMPGGKVLLVEGPDDKHVVIHLCKNMKVPPPDKIKPQEGIQNLLGTLPVELKGSSIEVLGVIVDANSDLSSRWQALRDRLLEAGYFDIPDSPDPAGIILEAPLNSPLLPRFGAWIMPDNQANGTLENFLLSLVPEDSILYHHVDKSINSIPEGERRFSVSDTPKAMIHTWLAWQKNPGLRMGTAIDTRAFNLDVPQVKAFISWLTKLFNDQSE